MASKQMLTSLLSSASWHHLARSHLFLTARSGLSRNRFWAQSMESDVLVYDFQDGCPPGERGHVFTGLTQSHVIFPNKACSVRLTELERDDGTMVYDEIKASISQKQVYWLMLPMCDTKEDVESYIEVIRFIDKDWLVSHGSLQIICETPLGLKNLEDILSSIPEVKAVIAGGGDYFRFAQGSSETLLPMLRWEILNACLRHQRFPIDSPPLTLQADEVTSTYFDSAKKSGFRSGLILHPQQAEVANSIFSPNKDELENLRGPAQTFLECRETGYKRASGEAFIGPPHLKQYIWQLTYHAQINAKKSSTTKSVDQDTLKKMLSILNDSNLEGMGDRKMLGFLALATTSHPRHEDLVANLGFSEAKYADEENNTNIEAARFVDAQLISRKTTSNQLYAICTYNVEITDEKFQPMFSVVLRLMEKRDSFEDSACCEGDIPHARPLPEPIRDPAVITKHKESATLLVDRDTFFSPSQDIHQSYCELLKLDAPLHHTTNPTVPSVLHLSCHNFATEAVSKILDVTYHAPMKTDTLYVRSLYQLAETEYLSVVQETGPAGRILSTVFFEELPMMVMEEILNSRDIQVNMAQTLEEEATNQKKQFDASFN